MSSRTVTSGDGLHRVGRDANRLVSLIEKLRRIGLAGIDGVLPELVLIGDQSVILPTTFHTSLV